MGHQLGREVAQRMPGLLDPAELARGVRAGYAGTTPRLSEAARDDALYEVQLVAVKKLPPKRQARALAQVEAARRRTLAGRKHAQQGRTFLALNAQREGWSVRPSGLQVKLLTRGKGAQPGPRDRVRVRFTGRNLAGLLVHRSPQAGERYHLRSVLPGWAEALRGMRPGGAVELVIPAELGYGLRGNARLKVGPRQVLRYRLELVEVLPARGKK